MFKPAKKHIKYFSGSNWINSCTFYGMSEENVKNITKSNSLFAQTFVDYHVLLAIRSNGHCLINNNISIFKNDIYIYIHTYICIYIYIYIYQFYIRQFVILIFQSN